MAIDLPGHGASTLPLGDMHGDARHVFEVALKIDQPIVLVGHSYGGAVITEAAHMLSLEGDIEVTHLIYIAAFVVDEGESVSGLAASLGSPPTLLAGALLPGPGSSLVLDCMLAHNALYGMCSAEVSNAAIKRLSPQPLATLTQRATGAPWKHLPSTYVVCQRDAAVHPADQQYMAARCTTTITLDADHSPFASMPRATADIIAHVVNQPNR